VIGIRRYPHTTDLAYAVDDARAIATLLVTQLGFPRENVFVILDPPPDTPDPDYDLAGTDATKAAIEEWVFTRLPARAAGPDDRVLFFYAGHGESRRLASGGHKGYLVPADGVPGAWHTFIETDDVIEAADFCEAKHFFYLFDSCFSGLAVARSDVQPSPFETVMLTNRARMGLTAGTAKQTVADRGPGGHSPFTSFVLLGLQGEAAQLGGQVITGSDLILYVRNQVAARYGDKQTPDYGKLPGHDSGGDFLFRLPPATELLVDLSEWVPVHNTKGPEIAALATAAAMEACLAQAGISVRLDANDLYAQAKEHDRIASEGTQLQPIVFVAGFFGVKVVEPEPAPGARETYHARFHAVPSLDDIPRYLKEGQPVIAPAWAHQSWRSATNGELPLPTDKDPVLGRLLVTMTRYDPDTEVFGFTPHWSTRWGAEGFGTMSRQVAEKLLALDQMLAVEVVGIGAAPSKPVVP
jgi:hypothetical protein